MKPLSECRLYTFVDTAFLGGRSVEAVARQLCEGGSDLIQLRAKSSTPDEVRRMAAALLPIAACANIGLVINDYPQIAADTGAPLCHLGQEDFSNAEYTHVSQIPLAGLRLKIGLSTHTPAQAEQALAAGADYIAVGPVYPTSTKPTAQPVTLEYIRWAARHVSIPWFAIGGITLENIGDVLDAGATRICVVSAILRAPDITEACRLFKKRLTSNQI
ncbi:MAG: thiamine phosphate synthase [Chloroflexi bacterium]|nr:thiamine phosphate synthase [Chloroflexota bacterium]